MEQGLLANSEVLQNQIILVDQLYSKGYSHFKVSVIIMFLYSVGKVIMLPIIFQISHELGGELIAWMISMFALSCGQVIHYWRVWRMTSNMQYFLKIAEKMRHAAYYPLAEVGEQARRTRVHPNMTNYLNPLDRINDRQLRILSLEIKFNFVNLQLSINIPSRLFFFIYQGLHIWGIIIFFNADPDNYEPAHHLLIVIIFLGTYQYLEFYSLILVILVAGPFLLIYSGIKYLITKRRKRKIAEALQGYSFNPKKLKGDLNCKICMQDYKQSEIITTLPCNQLHHFHSECVKEWIKVSDTCPLCRKQIGSE